MTNISSDYCKTVIYKIACCNEKITDCYVGHTVNFRKRYKTHQSDCKETSTRSNYYLYRFIRAHGGFKNWYMMELELFPCTSKFEATKRERYWIDKLQST